VANIVEVCFVSKVAGTGGFPLSHSTTQPPFVCSDAKTMSVRSDGNGNK